MNPRVFLVLPVLALAWMLLVPETSFAQRRILRGRYYDASYDPYYGGSYDSYAPRRGLFGRRAARYGQPNGQMYGQPYMTSPMMSVDGSATYDSFYPPSIGATADAGLIRLRVPPDAKVFIDDNPTSQTGVIRAFVTPPLKDNQNSYQIVARWMENGQERSVTRMVRPLAGQVVSVDLAPTTGPLPRQQQIPLPRTQGNQVPRINP
jgi:uncharacterized protein (TIGR03000 family)